MPPGIQQFTFPKIPDCVDMNVILPSFAPFGSINREYVINQMTSDTNIK